MRTIRELQENKILPHRFLPEYDISIWVDGNEIVVGDVDKMVDKYLTNNDMAVYNHMSCWDKRNCIYDKAKAIFSLGNADSNNWKDNPQIISNQMNRYIKDNYPPNNGLIVSGVMLRKHNSPQVIKCM